MPEEQVLINRKTPLMLLSGLKVNPTKESFFVNFRKTRKTLLFQSTKLSVKKTRTEDFGVPMGSYDTVEVCE